MRIDIISLLPELFKGPLTESIMKRGQEKGLIEIHIVDLRQYGLGKSRQLDDYPYGGGGGMVLMPEPLSNCIEELKSQRDYDEIIYLTPDGEQHNQSIANQLSIKSNLMLICGHYKGIDQRIRDLYVTREISIGDYVLTGGELAAMVLVDSICRIIPGVISDEQSALSDSFQDNLLAPPVYTRPSEFKGLKVPDILMSGNFKKIEDWRIDQAEARTKLRRPDLLD
jgi:tRNA (guanine37-N1)-methyltransferase